MRCLRVQGLRLSGLGIAREAEAVPPPKIRTTKPLTLTRNRKSLVVLLLMISNINNRTMQQKDVHMQKTKYLHLYQWLYVNRSLYLFFLYIFLLYMLGIVVSGSNPGERE